MEIVTINKNYHLGKTMGNLTTQTTLKKLERELAERILHLAAFLDTCFGYGSGGAFGNNIIKYIDGKTYDLYEEEYDQIDLSKYRIGSRLPYYYDYAYHSKFHQTTYYFEFLSLLPQRWGALDLLPKVRACQHLRQTSMSDCRQT